MVVLLCKYTALTGSYSQDGLIRADGRAEREWRWMDHGPWAHTTACHCTRAPHQSHRAFPSISLIYKVGLSSLPSPAAKSIINSACAHSWVLRAAL